MKQLFAISACILLIICFSLYLESPTFLTTEETTIFLSDTGITVNGGSENKSVFTSHDIIYYEDRDFHPNNTPYGEGQSSDRHSVEEANAHTVVNITAPGIYRVTGKLSAGQIRVDLGTEAYYDSQAVVTLILDNTEIACSVAPAILFLNVYECDENWSTREGSPVVDTTNAGANLILENKNVIRGSHVAKIYKDNGKAKKLWKQDGAVHSCVSMTIDGTGQLDLTADREGISSQLHLTIQNGDFIIRAVDDGINASGENISVVTINDGHFRILSGLGESQGDGIDSNGYLVLNGGSLVVWSTPLDSPLDSEIPPFIHGGIVIAFGSSKDPAHWDSKQVTLDLVGKFLPDPSSSIAVVDEQGIAILAYLPEEDSVLGPFARRYDSVILSSPDFCKGALYTIQLGPSFDSMSTDGLLQNIPIQNSGILLQNGDITLEDGELVFHETNCETTFQTRSTVSYFDVAPIARK